MAMMKLRDKIDPKVTALIVIDLQIDFASPDGVLAQRGRDLANVNDLYTNLEKLIPIAEKVKVPILYTKQIYDRSKLNKLQLEQYDLDGKYITCDINTKGHEFYKINPPAEDIFVKYNFNVFSNQDLIHRLNKLGIKTLIITGMDTIFCVETAIRNGFDLGYKIVVPSDLIAGNNKYQDLNDKTLTIVNKTFGVVTTTQEIIDIWSTY